MNIENRLILASGSPRRLELMRLLEIPFSVCVPHVDEGILPGEVPVAVPLRVSRLKAEWVANEQGKGIVIAADTVVVHKGELLGKPQDADHARRMLFRLRDDRHLVLSGVTVMDASTGKQITELCETTVWLRPMEAPEIESYVASGDPLDKAAAYAIQNSVFAPVAKIDGCPANVMGLPVCHVARSLRRLGIALPPSLPTQCDIRYGYQCALAEHVVPRAS